MKMIKYLILLPFLVVITNCDEKSKQTSKETAQETPPITPRWAFEHVVWEDSINTQEAAMDLVNRYKSRDFPVGGIIIDSPWSTSYNSFEWDTARYPAPQKMINSLHDLDIRVIMWMTAIMNETAKDAPVQKNKNYDWLIDQEYVTDNGDTIHWWKGAGVHIDYTNPKAVSWLHEQMDPVMEMGIDGWKVDMGEWYLDDTVLTSEGEMPKKEFQKLYYADMYDYTVGKNPEGIILARPYSHQAGGACAPISKNPMGWCGDFYGNWEGLKHQINNIYKSAEIGYGAVGCEVGGYWKGRSNKEQLVRYAQFGAMTACMVNGGVNGAFTNHLPWYHDEEAEKCYRQAAWLHSQLIPYLFSETVNAHLHGGALLNNVSFEQESHILGQDIFTKAITSSDSLVEFRLPGNDNWVEFWTNEEYKGGELISKDYLLNRFPLFIRSGAIIPMNIHNSYSGIGDVSLKNKQTILIYPGKKSSYRYYRPTGTGTNYETIDITFDNASGILEVDGESTLSYAFLIQNINKPGEVKDAEWEYNAKDNLLKILKQGKSIRIEIVMK